MNCRIGLDCSQFEQTRYGCVNYDYCSDLAEPWALPYEYKEGCLTVGWTCHEEVKKAGWAHALPLQHIYQDGVLEVISNALSDWGFCCAVPIKAKHTIVVNKANHYLKKLWQATYDRPSAVQDAWDYAPLWHELHREGTEEAEEMIGWLRQMETATEDNDRTILMALIGSLGWTDEQVGRFF